MKRLHWTQTAQGRAKMREIALANNNVLKARAARANGIKARKDKEAEAKVKREITLSIHDWQVTFSDNEIRIKK